MQRDIINELNVKADFDAESEIRRRVAFLADYLVETNTRALVLGISGGVDSLVAGCLAQRAVDVVRNRGREATFIAMRLPYGQQRDESDAQAALQVISPDKTLAVNIQAASDSMLQALVEGGTAFRDATEQDFLLGNIKARQRMIAQYAVAGAYGGLVVGTDHAAEALMGFFTKFGDGAADITPLAGLNKRRVRALGAAMGAPEALVMKIPTADLESLSPLKPDEDAFGVTYGQIDDFLEGKDIPAAAADVILLTYRRSEHKRSLPIAP
ncbi:ammonia-dependent NAD(+) synthetase [Pollutimonas thiosulfatoxidans]|uniref:NH(3)-dependent NAD(+) synthetase n=1 Tax=Pollutimonas thiosulfatoxidans TaxID=2028345 RepID=A0A410GG65_9BURK|nr:ammonia-dependent NAD(+) synthetase [Pollutimonas thiosulfatoxidans]MBF6618089.1 ammonia-dependent NAD(+) synthetase [Candidimonas sp.]NYT45491.1 ammonia-dependent NAD(+) synthetase [Alcaligenaceae bacterium]QAA95281.1 NAD(+) synthase [Pollutimonas thiosulfatoxidans]